MRKIYSLLVPVSLFYMASLSPLKAQVPGNGLLFDGDDDYVNVYTTSSDELNPTESLTLECWVYLNEIPSDTHNPHLISRFNCYSLTVGANGLATAYIQNDEGDWFSEGGTTTITTNKWYHLAATYDGSNLRVFVNGEQEGITTAFDTMARTTLNFRIGARNAYVTTTNTNGIIDEARVWDITRTQSEIQGSMNRTIPGSTPGLVGYWRFDDGSGTNTDDQTVYDNNGELMHMSLPSAWITSTASIGESSIFAVSADIAETSECAVDVDFLSGEGPGSGHSMAVMQVNQLPNSVIGLHPDRADHYWEVWSEDPDFDGDFTANVRFHYDDLFGLPNENSLELFRRDDATGIWSAVTGYTVVSNDGGSSPANDGIGYVELPITENSTGDFSGQYILSWSDAPPVVSNIPDQSIAEGTPFATINLDDYVEDPDNTDSEITWTATGQTDFTVEITGRVATITTDDPEWNGNNVITFTAEDPEGETNSDDATFEVTPVNDPPVVGDIPDQEVVEGTAFTTINLDNFVSDIDNDITTMTWTATGQTDLTVDITARVATITLPNADWNGSEIITFQAEDPEGGTDTAPATFTVTPVNDPPVVDDIPDEVVAEGTAFATINLDDFVADVDDLDNTITWTATGQSNLIVDISGGVATITPDDENWNGSEIITFQAEDPDGESDSDQATFTVSPVNDAPAVDDIPDQEVAEGTAFAIVNLDDYVADVDDADNAITWTATGQSNLNVEITGRVATITVNEPEWNGIESITFTAEDPSGLQDDDIVKFTVTFANDIPEVADIPDQTIAEGQNFSQINLDDFVADPDHLDDSLGWTAMGQSAITVSIADRVATLIVDPEWNGSETIIFTATDPLGASDTNTSIFTVTGINDAPILSKAIPDTTAEPGKIFLFVLDPNTFTDVDPGDVLVISADMSMGGSTPAWITFNAASGTFSGTPADEDLGVVEVVVTSRDGSSASVADTFNIEVKSYVGISYTLEGLEINLYPNPNNGRFVIESNGFELKDVTLEIFNERGQLVWNRKINDKIGSLRESVNLSNASNGLYFLRIRNKSGMLSRRFVIGY